MPIRSRKRTLPDPRIEPMQEPTYQVPVQSRSVTPVLVILLIIASYFLGMLTAKVQYLEQGKTTTKPSAQAAALSPGISAAPTVPPKVNVTTGHLPIKGNANAKVTVIEFADFQCPFCERWFKDVEPQIIKDYVDSGKVKFAFRHYAFLDRPPTQESTWASEAAECANDQGKFWDYHDYLYNNQGPEDSGTFTKDKLEGFAATLGLDTAKFNSCLESDQHAKDVSSDLTAGQAAGVSGTPATFVNGQIVVGAQPYSAFKTMIDAELSKKK